MTDSIRFNQDSNSLFASQATPSADYSNHVAENPGPPTCPLIESKSAPPPTPPAVAALIDRFLKPLDGSAVETSRRNPFSNPFEDIAAFSESYECPLRDLIQYMNSSTATVK